READTVALEYVTPEQVTIRKKFFFPSINEKKDNFVAKLDVDFTNNGAAPYANPGYFLGIGSAARIHRNDYPSYTRLVWLFGGRDALAGVPRRGRPNLQRTLPTLSRPETLSSARPARTQRSRSHGIRHLQDHLPGVAQRLEHVSQFPWQLCRCHSRTNDNCEAVALASAN